jgi:ABC-type transport system involved in multi-copper enzyme maturation permease subunit
VTWQQRISNVQSGNDTREPTGQEPAQLGSPVALSPGHTVTRLRHHSISPSPLRAWFFLVWLSLQRQARVGQIVWIALGLLAFSGLLVGTITVSGWWGMQNRRLPRSRDGVTFKNWAELTDALSQRAAQPGSPEVAGINQAIVASYRAALEKTDFYVFSNFLVFTIFVSFLLPIWSLSFAADSLGGDREGGSLVWLLTRPLSRPAIYLAKFAALLPWSFGLSVGGFAVLCLAGGRPGLQALRFYWPAVFCGTLAFSALYHLMGAFFKRPAIIALLYSFFLETLLGNMPGYLKRGSLSFYTRCMMFDAAQNYGVEPEKPSVYLAVDGSIACWVLMGATVVFLLVGMILFSRSEYLAADG